MAKTGTPRRRDLTGQEFSNWTVLGYDRTNERREAFWLCRCSCGTERTVKSASLTQGTSTNCGCLRGESKKKHGMCGSRTYQSWESMKRRCTNPNDIGYRWYGAIGIRVHEPWIHDFSVFLKDMGERPPNTSLDRINPYGHYVPENCRWASHAQQASNKRSYKRLIAFGKRQMVSEWAREMGIPAKTIYERLRAGWSTEDAVSKPRRPGRPKRPSGQRG